MRLWPFRSPRCRGSVHRIRSAGNGFTLSDPAFDGSLWFKARPERPLLGYRIGDVLVVLMEAPVAFRIEPLGGGRIALLADPNRRLYFSFGDLHVAGIAKAAADRTAIGEPEHFVLGRAKRPPPAFRDLIACIDALVDDPCARLATDSPSRRYGDVVFRALVALHTFDDEERLLACFDVADPDVRGVLRADHPGSCHTAALDALFDPSPPRSASIAFEQAFWLEGVRGDAASLPFALNCRARRRTTPTRKACILATMRNEGPYILDWLAYHRALGLTDVFLYVNDSDDGSSELLAELAAKGYADVTVNVVPEGGSAQNSAYKHALGLRPELLEYEWCAVIDLDEFLVVDPSHYGSFADFLDGFDGAEADAIALNWLVFGPSGHLRRDPGAFLIDRYPACLPDVNPHIKSIVRPRAFIGSSAHYPYTYRGRPFAFVDALGRPHAAHPDELAWSTRPDASRAGVAHYIYKSLDEFLLKWSRNRGDNPRRERPTNEVLTTGALESFCDMFRLRGAIRPAIGLRSAAAKAELAAMRSQPRIGALAAEIEARYLDRIDGIRALFLDCPAVRESPRGAELRDLILQARAAGP